MASGRCAVEEYRRCAPGELGPAATSRCVMSSIWTVLRSNRPSSQDPTPAFYGFVNAQRGQSLPPDETTAHPRPDQKDRKNLQVLPHQSWEAGYRSGPQAQEPLRDPRAISGRSPLIVLPDSAKI